MNSVGWVKLTIYPQAVCCVQFGHVSVRSLSAVCIMLVGVLCVHSFIKYDLYEIVAVDDAC